MRNQKMKHLLLALAGISFALSGQVHAKCSIRVADSLITTRYQGCSPKMMLSYLYNDLVTPFSFTCAKKLSETCREEKCDSPSSVEEKNRCLGTYVSVLRNCEQEINDAARMARCKDTQSWPVEALLKSTAAPVAKQMRAPSAAETTPIREDESTLSLPITPLSPVYGPPESW